MRRKITFTRGEVNQRGLVWDGHSFPYNQNHIEYARTLRKQMTKSEKRLWYDFLRAHEKKFYR